VSLEIEHRIANELARSVKGHVTAALHLEKLDAARAEEVRTRYQILLLRRATESYHWRMLHEEKNILRDRAGNTLSCHLALKLETLLVSHPAEADHPQLALRHQL
jgi:hypothetical protein